MALTQQQLSEIYSNLANTVGPQQAEFLMAQQPPGGWEELATKRDLADLDLRTRTSIAEVHAKMDKGFAETKEQFAEVHAKVDNGFAEVKMQFAEVKEQFAEVKEQFAEVREQFAEVKEQFAAIDTRFADFSDRRSRDVWAFIATIAVMTVSICGSVFLSVWQLAPT